MITINNAPFGYASMYCDQWIEVTTTTGLAPTDVHRFIFDFYYNSVLVGRFKTFAHDYPNGVFNLSKIAANLFNQLGLNELEVVNLGGLNNNLGRSNTDITFEVQIGEQVNNVETTNINNIIITLYNGLINYNNPLAASGVILDNTIASPLIGLPYKRRYWHSATSQTLIPFLVVLPYTSIFTVTLDITELDADFDQTSSVSTDLLKGKDKGCYYIGGSALTNINSLVHGKNYLMQYGTYDITVAWSCDAFHEFYYLNSYGFFEQFVFMYGKAKTANEKSTISGREQIYSANRLSNPIFNKTFGMQVNHSIMCSTTLQSDNDYLAFVELINSPMVYYVQGANFIPCEITTTSTDGYVSRYDKAKEISIEAKIFNQWK